MKGGINFELKADNIIHAPVDTPKWASGKAGIRNPEQEREQEQEQEPEPEQEPEWEEKPI